MPVLHPARPAERVGTSKRALAAIVVAAGMTLLACSAGVEGTYVGVKGQSFFDRIELASGGKMKVTLVGVPYDATYEVKGSKLVLNNGGQISELTIDHDCLVDPIGGRYCKSGG